MTESAADSFRAAVQPPDEHQGPTLAFAFRDRELLVTRDAAIPSVDIVEQQRIEIVRRQYLGSFGPSACFSMELDTNTEAPTGMQFQSLRQLFGPLDDALYRLAGTAIQIVDWERTHLFCGRCGGRTTRSTTERSRRCEECDHLQFPRLAPAVIVAVERGDEILLGRSPHFPPGIFSVLAGFVEPGESAEDAVIREVEEEVGVRIGDVRYFGSQPWPFPNSLMLGYRSRHESGEIQVDGVEIEDAGWFRHDALPPTFSSGISISHWLIRDFVERHRTS